MAFIIKDTNPQYSGMGYFVGTRKVKDPYGRDCEAADFGAKSDAKKYASRSQAEKRVSMLNQMAGHNQFVVEEESIYGQQYGRKMKPNGFTGFGRLPEPNAEVPQPSYGGFHWEDEDNGYNGF